MSAHAQYLSNTTNLPLSQVIGAFSYALDLTEGQPQGHCIRACWIGMHIGKLLGMPAEQLWNLYYTLLLKDAGCSSNAARLCQLYSSDDRQVKNRYKLVDSQNKLDVAAFVLRHAGSSAPFLQKLNRWVSLANSGEELSTELTMTRCERGANIAIKLGFNEYIADGIRYLDEHWNGKGQPYHISGEQIPVYSQIALIAQVFDVFFQVGGAQAALSEVRKRSGSWFDPVLARLCLQLQEDTDFWTILESPAIDDELIKLEPGEYMMAVNEDQLDRITEAFGMVVDVKSPFTHDHSARVAGFSSAIASQFDFDAKQLRQIKRAAYLHDLGKLGVSNSILDKPGKLDADEWEQVKRHPALTAQILGHLKPFAEIASMSAAHHEKLDGSGYPLGLAADKISRETRIITIADIFDALTAARPYRDALPVKKSLAIIESQLGSAIDADCYEALRNHVKETGLLK